jgi:hypothetical protein
MTEPRGMSLPEAAAVLRHLRQALGSPPDRLGQGGGKKGGAMMTEDRDLSLSRSRCRPDVPCYAWRKPWLERMTTKQERAALISCLAFQMAESGQNRNYQHIEIALRASGHGEARSVLDHRATRQLLDEICTSKREKANASRPQ